MQVKEGHVVSVSYELYATNKDNQLIEKTDNNNPLVFLFGLGHLLKDFEDNLRDKATGDSFDFNIESKNAYGEFNQQAIVELARNVFQIDGQEKSDLLKIGNTIDMQDQEGNPMQGRVLEVGAEKVKMDFNHPLAGVDLNFKGKVLNVRLATPEELDHGHVHGEGGVHH